MVRPKSSSLVSRVKRVDAALAIQVGVVGKHPVRLKGLLGMLHQQAEVVCRFIGQAETSADIFGVVKVFFNQGTVVCSFELGCQGGRALPEISLRLSTAMRPAVIRLKTAGG